MALSPLADRKLERKVAIVAGGSSGIGAAIAHRMIREGATVIIADLAGDAMPIDAADPVSVNSLIQMVLERHGRLDCLVNSAGIGQDIPFLETTLDSFDRMIAVNLRGTFILGQAAAKAMVETGGGSIINIASVSGVTGNAGRAAYGASKGGVVILSQVMAVELAAYKIRVNVLAPGPVDTPLVQRMHSAQARQRWTDLTPMHRYAQPEEIAGAAVFLCSDDASFITGHVMAVDGGFLACGFSA